MTDTLAADLARMAAAHSDAARAAARAARLAARSRKAWAAATTPEGIRTAERISFDAATALANAVAASRAATALAAAIA